MRDLGEVQVVREAAAETRGHEDEEDAEDEHHYETLSIQTIYHVELQASRRYPLRIRQSDEFPRNGVETESGRSFSWDP